MTTLRAMPVLQVSDVKRAEAFWTVLGFASHGIWGEAPHGFCIVQRGDVTFALDGGPGDPPLNQYWAAYVYVDDVAALHEEFAALNAPGLTEIRSPEHYGCRDFDVVDPDGHRIAFGQSLNPDPGPGLDKDRGRG